MYNFWPLLENVPRSLWPSRNWSLKRDSCKQNFAKSVNIHRYVRLFCGNWQKPPRIIKTGKVAVVCIFCCSFLLCKPLGSSLHLTIKYWFAWECEKCYSRTLSRQNLFCRLSVVYFSKSVWQKCLLRAHANNNVCLLMYGANRQHAENLCAFQ